MTSEMQLTEGQREYYLQEGHCVKNERGNLALIMKDGTVVMDYPEEVIAAYNDLKRKAEKERGD